MVTAEQIERAHQHIKKDIHQTPLIFSPKLSELSGASVYLKMEQWQVSGSFKIRGVLTKLNSLKEEDFNKEFVAASTGNHAAAFAHAADKKNFKAVLFLPESVNETKLNALDSYAIKKNISGATSKETELKATVYAQEKKAILIHPYNDWEIIKGQGTIGVELKKQLENIDQVLVPIGGGGLASGLSLFFKETATKIIGCQPINAAEMYSSIKLDRIVSTSDLATISDATAGGIEENALTFEVCKNELSGFELVDELGMKEAIAFMVKYHQIILEPAAALSVAAILNTSKYRGERIVLILTGRKINSTLLTKILSDYGNDY